ncbi:MAG: succinate dehydrogenase, cytochrome b556 subunit [SAR86 cluster bacterium]|jgi:succinate dehydrogenase / fumarate reductase cytochrome b subunit|nr:succinate dehydrogenase, cytochrome b556 subunit [SAR86 cluster bacterium]|tara:strand:+ start:5715 stop:6098 length:384 start_codon:yes stop_codon:yes gene_type:complete
MIQKRPTNINLLKIQLPLSALLSITHRISGMLIFFLVLPGSAIALSFMYDNQDSYNNFINYYSNNLTIKLTFITLVLIFQYHIFTGIRHMLMDFHFLEESLSTSFRSAIFTLLVFLLNAILTILVML